jgi:hypothetical protein
MNNYSTILPCEMSVFLGMRQFHEILRCEPNFPTDLYVVWGDPFKLRKCFTGTRFTHRE